MISGPYMAQGQMFPTPATAGQEGKEEKEGMQGGCLGSGLERKGWVHL